jgi:SAM (Sterile alpha motif) domain-containing protein
MQTIENWLGQLGLGKYTEAFVDNDVDLRALSHITEDDLRELGVSLGHRKIILAAITSTCFTFPRCVAISDTGNPARTDGRPTTSQCALL